MKGRLGEELRVYNVLDAIREIEGYTCNVTIHQFLDHSMMLFACIKQLELIGEATHEISWATKDKFPEIEWNIITGMRNILVHENYGIDAELVWQIISIDLPVLKMKFERMKSAFAR